MGTWAVGTLGYLDRKPDGSFAFEPNTDGVVRMASAIDESGNEASVVLEEDAEGFTVLMWRVRVD